MSQIRRELDVFLRCDPAMRVLIVSNMIYAFVLPVIEIFVAAFVMRNSHAVGKVVTYQLSLYAATPFAFYVNGKLLKYVEAKHLYASGMLLSGAAMVLLMQFRILTQAGIVTSGLAMGFSTGLFWANRGFLALSTTHDGNRNYFYGVELFASSLTAVAVPAAMGWFIGGTAMYGWLGGVTNRAYHVVALAVLGLTALAAFVLETGKFRSPGATSRVFFPPHPIWRRMLELAVLKGLAQGYIVTAPAMLIMLLVGQEGTLGATQAVGGVVSACLLYKVGRTASPAHRKIVFAAAVLLFFLGALVNAVLFSAAGVLIFMGCLMLAKPLLDLAYNPIEWRVIDMVSHLEGRSEFDLLFNHEFGLFAGRCLGCSLFLAIVYEGSAEAALKYALPVVALLQLLSIPVAARTFRGLAAERADSGSELEARPAMPEPG